jgi:CRISPR-associated endonuclease/helicase Cas3
LIVPANYGIDNEKKRLADKIADLALEFKESKRAILVFALTVENVNAIANELNKTNQKFQLLTGTMRGLERDQLLDKPIFKRFLPNAEPGEETVYLVCTSAGEVGVNMSADHLVCDLTTFESMAQRFGRVNRFGERQDTQIHVVYSKKFDDSDYDQARKKTLELLQKLKGDASPAALSKLDPELREAAFAPEPTIPPVTDILFDSWALTTIREKLPGRPPVEPYLHGIAEWQPPETYVAWREEVDIIREELLEQYNPEGLLEDYPLKPHELLRDRSDRILENLQKIAEGHPNKSAWLIDDFGKLEVLPIARLTAKENRSRIDHSTILLPPSAGGLTGKGMLDGTSEPPATDVADEWKDENGRRRRIRVWDDDPDLDKKIKGMRLIRAIDTQPDLDEVGENGETPVRRYWYWYELPQEGDSDGSAFSTIATTWEHHTNDVTRNAERIADRLFDKGSELHTALVLAGKYHDLGKKRKVWQWGIGNDQYPRLCYAKSGRLPDGSPPLRPRQTNDYYRHEFGSLLDVESEPDFQKLSADLKDLVLHLIAVHHGRGRPHFPQEEAFDTERRQNESDGMASEVPRRFARLQRKYGRWGLAYLESLLRSADYAASANPSQPEGKL